MFSLKRIFNPLLLVGMLLFNGTSSLLYAQATVSGVELMQGFNLSELKKAYAVNDETAIRTVRELVSKADQYLQLKPVSVTDKLITPPSGSKHDYMSQAPYFWYDSSKPNGLPYLRRDGERNPEINKITDRKNIGDLETATTTLALAWYFTGKEMYAAKASVLLKTWFIDTASRMNPNLDYGQGIPGINTGRGIGIIETIALIGIADAALMLTGSSSWKIQEQDALKKWYAQYLQWMQTSANGKEEHAAKNNHGTWYYTQAVAFALFSGDRSAAGKLAEESKRLMDGQFDAYGKQPLELERTNALWYSTYNLQAWVRLAALAAKTGIDLWQHTNSKGTGILKAIKWLAPYAAGKQNFTYQQIDKYNKNVFYALLKQALSDYVHTHSDQEGKDQTKDMLSRLLKDNL